MICETLKANPKSAKTAEWPSYSAIYFDERPAAGGNTLEAGNLTIALPYLMKMSRSGYTFSSFVSSDRLVR